MRDTVIQNQRFLRPCVHIWMCLALLAIFSNTSSAQTTFVVTAPGFAAYSIDGADNPSLTLVRGETYIFDVNASFHPFYIKSVQTNGTGGAYNDGVTNNGDDIGQITFTVPQTAPNTLFYDCSVHAAMTGLLTIIDPSVTIGKINVNTGVTLTSTGPGTGVIIPESASTLTSPNWTAVPNVTNITANGTNTTTFQKPAGNTIFLRVKKAK